MIKKIHIYLGLVNLVILIVFGVAGLTAFVRRISGPSQPEITSQRRIAFVAAPNATDRQIADAVALTLQAAGCFPAGSPPRDARQNLRMNCYSSNGGHRVTFLETENQIYVRSTRNSVWGYLSSLHALLPRDSITNRDMSHRLWSYYVEFSVWSLSAMCLTGVYLWLTTRPRVGLAWCAFAGGCAVFAVLWVMGS